MRARPTRTFVPLGAAALALLVWAAPAAGAPGAKTVTLRGTILVRHADVFSKGIAEYWYTLKTPNGPVGLKFRGRSAQGLGKLRVQVHGTKVGSTVHVWPGGLKILSGRRLASRRDAIGTSRLAVVLFNFSNDRSQP